MRRSGFIAVGLLVVVSSVVGLLAWRWNERGPSRPSVNGAIGRFRTASPGGTGTGLMEPRPGVYLYKATGRESLSFMGTRQSQGPIDPGTVVLRPNGCWQFRVDFNSFHDQTWNRCSTGGKLMESGGTTDQRFDFVAFKASEHTDVTCTPRVVVADLAALPGARSPVRCTGRSQTTKTTFAQTGSATFVGRETVAVGATRVLALHTREDLRMSGGQTGEVKIDIWFAATDGLPLKEAHSLRVASPAPAPLNHVTYVESGSWQLTSMTPRT